MQCICGARNITGEGLCSVFVDEEDEIVRGASLPSWCSTSLGRFAGGVSSFSDEGDSVETRRICGDFSAPGVEALLSFGPSLPPKSCVMATAAMMAMRSAPDCFAS